MKWFGKAYGAPYEEEGPRIETPVGAECVWCHEPIAADDDGMAYDYLRDGVVVTAPRHYECNLRAIVGGLNHLRGRCTCCGGDQPPDPEGMTRRQAAIAAVREWEKR
jgi:hypothetical protein